MILHTFIKTHIVNYTVDKLIDSICDNLGIYPDMEIKVYYILGLGNYFGLIYADLGDYILEIPRSGYKTRFKVIDKMSPIILDKHITHECIITMPYTIDNFKIAKNILIHMNMNMNTFTSGVIPLSRLTKLINSTCTTDKV